MASRFRRTLFSPATHPPPPEKPCHVRSISLPSRSHPSISQIKDEVTYLRSWTSRSGDRTSGWLCDGLVRLKNLHDSVDDLLNHPQTQDSLHRQSDLVQKLLEDFLCFVDVYGTFRETLVGLKEEQLTAQIAVRRRDESNAALYVTKSRKKMDKEMAKLASTVRSVGRCSARELILISDGDAELAGVLQDVVEVTVSATVSLVGETTACSSSKINRNGWNLLKRKKDKRGDQVIREVEEVESERICGLRNWGEDEVKRLLRRMEELEKCMASVESEIERVFKSLIGARVSLLNVLTQKNSC